jgi:hypothetical protein
MNRYGYKIFRDGDIIGSYRHGESVRILPDGNVTTHNEMNVSIPTVDTESFTFVDTKEIILKTETAGAKIYYTTDGSNPTNKSSHYTGPFSISESCELRAIAQHTEFSESDISRIYFEKVDESDIESPPFVIEDFLISQSFSGYLGPEGKNKYPFNESNIKWEKAETDERGIVWLSKQLTPSAHCHAIAVTDIFCEEEAEATLLTGTHDGAFMWLNEELILDNYQERPFYYNQFKIPIKLKKGKNRLEMIIMQGGGSWGFNVNLQTNGNKIKIVLPEK